MPSDRHIPVVFQNNCPYCGTKNVAFTILYEESTGYQEWNDWHWDTFAKCGYCKRGVLAKFLTSGEDVPPSSGDGVKFQEIYPSLPENGAPAHTPENVARFFEQAMDNLPKKLGRSRRYVPQGTGYRSEK